MAISEKGPENMKALKNGVIGVAVLIVLGTLAPLIIYETTGVDLSDLCVDAPDSPDDASAGTLADCVEENKIRDTVLEALGYISIVVAVIGFVMLIVIGIKY